jgi:hypothetical protein
MPATADALAAATPCDYETGSSESVAPNGATQKPGSDTQLVQPAKEGGGSKPSPSLLMRIFGAILAGIMFGYALNKGAVYRADVIIRQFSFADNTMLLVCLLMIIFRNQLILLYHIQRTQMFLSASASSIIVIAALKSSPWRASVMEGGKKYVGV